MERPPAGVTIAAMASVTTRARVLVAGAGVAGVETALALRAFAGDAARVDLVDPGRRFRIPATATGRAFGVGRSADRLIADVAAAAGARLIPGRLTAVDPPRHLAMLAGGRLLTYDALVVAIGASTRPSIRGALTFAGHADAESVRSVVDDMAVRAARRCPTRLAVVVPPGCSWPLAAYELALLAHDHLSAAGAGDAVRIELVTAEETPLGVFGPDASAAVARMLGRSGIEVHPATQVVSWDWGTLTTAGGATIAADRVIALPRQAGPGLDGLPADAEGFIRADDDGAVPGAPDVWAIGDGSTFPVKQGGIACQQADSVAAAIARRIGVDAEEVPFHPTLRGWVWDGRSGRFLRADLTDADDGGDHDVGPLWWPVAKVAGRFLSPFLAGWHSDDLVSMDRFPARELR